MDDQTNGLESRRSVIQKIAAASVVGVGAIGNAGATPISTDGTDVQLVKDPNGINREDLADIQNSVKSQSAVSGDCVMGVPVFDSSENEVLAHATKITASGEPLSYTLYFSNEKENSGRERRRKSGRNSESRKTQKAIKISELDRYIDGMKSSSNVHEYKKLIGDEQTAGKVDSQSMSIEWNYGGNHACQTTDGDNEIKMDNDVFRAKDESSSDERRWAISTVSTANPAVNRTGNWFADELGGKEVVHKWPEGDLSSSSPGVVDTAPSGNKDGEVKSTTYSFGFSSDGSADIGVSTTYRQTSKEERTDITDSYGHDDEAGWKWDYEDEAQYRSVHETMSVSYLEDMSFWQSDPVVAKVKMSGEFSSYWTPTVSSPEASLDLEATEL